MSDKKLGTSPAFPRPIGEYKIVGDGKYNTAQEGMSKRLWIATQLYPVFARGLRLPEDFIERNVKQAYKVADELLKQEKL